MGRSLKLKFFESKQVQNDSINIKRTNLSFLELKLPQTKHRMKGSLKSEIFESKQVQNDSINIKRTNLSFLELKSPQTKHRMGDL